MKIRRDPGSGFGPTGIYDQAAVIAWLREVYRDAHGLISIAHADAGGNFHGASRTYDGIEAVASAIQELERHRPRGIYLRCTTLAQAPGPGRRGAAADSLELPMFWSDVDFGEVGHAVSTANLPLPPDEESARAVVLESGLPGPTTWVHSGGGLYACWLLEHPFLLPGTAPAAAAVSRKVQEVLAESARRLGYHYGAGVGDLARVLRVPGTVNRKTTLERPCRVSGPPGPRFHYDEFSELVNGLPLATDRPVPGVPRRRARSSATIGPFDALADAATWEDVLRPAGYTFVRREADGAELWLRPDDGSAAPPSSEYSVRCGIRGVPVAVNFSEAGPLPVGEGHRLTMGRVFAHLHHRADESAAARDLLAAVAGEGSASTAARALPEPVLAEIARRCLGHTHPAIAVGSLFAEQPLPLAAHGPLPPFPVDALPRAVADMVAAVSEFTQTDPGMAGTTALAMLATAAGGCAAVQPQPGWVEPLNLYTVVIAAPGERKSAVQALLSGPIVDAERQLAEATKDTRIEAETTREIIAKQAERARKEAARADGDARDRLISEAIDLGRAADQIEVPVVPRLLADDVTPEACASLLADQGGRLAVVTAEGGLFDVIAGRYSNNVPVLDVWLKGHSGDQLRVDRKGRDPEYVSRPALTLALMAQPTVLTAIGGNRAFRGRGLLARFLFALPPSRMGHRKTGTAPVPATVRGAYADLLRGLVLELAGWRSEPAALTLTPEASEQLLDLQRRIEPMLGKDGRLHPIVDWGAKEVGETLRIAGLLHLGDRPSDGWRHPLSGEALERAERIIDYYQEHALQAFAAMRADPVLADAKYLLERIAALGREIVSTRDVHAASSRSRFAKLAELQPVLAVLADHGYIAPVEEHRGGSVGRRPSPRWHVHPDVLAQADGRT